MKYLFTHLYTTISTHHKKILIYLLGGILIGFIVLTLIVYFLPTSVIDKKFSDEVQEHQYPLLDIAMKIISWPGSMPFSIIMVLSTSLLLLLNRFKKEALYTLLSLLAGLITYLIKIVINRPRPTENLVRIIEKAQYQSFPSGHVLFYVVFFGFVIVLMFQLKTIQKTLRIVISGIAILLIFTIPFSRMYLGAHWFTDVAGGFLLGIITLYTLTYLYLKNG